jgi:TatD DNase family protein
VDVHTHLDKLEEGPEAAVQAALAAHVERLITIGTDPEDLPIVLQLSEKYSPYVYCTLGIHPHEGAKYTTDVGDYILKHASHPRVLALGEIGLDYFYNHSDRKDQLAAFHAQMEIACHLKMPIEIHTRDAEEDTIQVLKKYNGQVTGLIHCFTSSQWLADQVLDLGYNISISGVVTFKNADSLRATVKSIPLNRIHIETDAPFLSPVPMRGRKNTSAFVVHTAKVVAELKEISIEELQFTTTENCKKLFPKLK